MYQVARFGLVRSRRVPAVPGLPSNLLLHCNGVDGSTTFIDSSASAHTVTPSASAVVDTDQSKFGGASAYLPGGTQYLALDGSSDFAFGTGDFTIDFWVRIAGNLSSYQMFYDSTPTSAGGNYVTLEKTATSNILQLFVNGSYRITGTTAFVINTWYHVALTRLSGNTRLFLNGTQEGSTYSDATNYGNGSGRPFIGGYGFTPGSLCLDGWIDEVRVIKGTAAWSANFTPPSAAYTS